MSSRIPVALATLAVVIGLTSLTPAATRGATHAVTIANFAFAPATLTVAVGDTVTWTNEDAVEHTATSTSGAFDSGSLAQGASYSFTFTAAGTYDYLCTPHPTMTGRITVVAAATPPSAPATGGEAPSGELPDVAMAAPSPIGAAGLAGLALLGAAITLAVVRLEPAVRRRRR